MQEMTYLFQRDGRRENGLKGGKSRRGDQKGGYGGRHKKRDGLAKDCASGGVRSEWLLQAKWRWRLVGHVDGLDVVCESETTQVLDLST